VQVVREDSAATFVFPAGEAARLPRRLTTAWRVLNAFALDTPEPWRILRNYMLHTPCHTLVRDLYLAEGLWPDARPLVGFYLPGPSGTPMVTVEPGQPHLRRLNLSARIEQRPEGPRPSRWTNRPTRPVPCRRRWRAPVPPTCAGVAGAAAWATRCRWWRCSWPCASAATEHGRARRARAPLSAAPDEISGPAPRHRSSIRSPQKNRDKPMSVITHIEDLRVLAQRRVPRMFYDYADSGSWTEGTYRANESDFQKIKLRQRVLVDMDHRSTATTMIGQDVAMPVALAPTGLTGMQHADGEILAARAAEKFGVPFTLSTMSICSIEDVAAHTTKPFWFQLYVMKDRGFIERLIERAKAARCSALVLTADLQILGQRHKDLKNGLSAPPKPTLANLINLATKPRWCLGMLGTKRRQFGNIVGHVSGVETWARCPNGRPSSSTLPVLGRCAVDQEPVGRQADHQGHHGRGRRQAGRRFRRRCADRLQPRRPPARRRALQHLGPAAHRGRGG
jgi:hypothetical protein